MDETMKIKKDMKIHKWTVMSAKKVKRGKSKNICIMCRCECGYEGFVDVTALTHDKSKGCSKCSNFNTKHKYSLEDVWKSTALIVYHRGKLKSKERKFYSDGDITFEEFCAMSQYPCRYCGLQKVNKYNKYITKEGKYHKQKSGQQIVSQERAEAAWFYYNGLDRVDNNLPHNKDNCVPCCYLCNMMKKALTKEDFLNHIKQIAEFQGWT